jgi:hypothetical protein
MYETGALDLASALVFILFIANQILELLLETLINSKDNFSKKYLADVSESLVIQVFLSTIHILNVKIT